MDEAKRKISTTTDGKPPEPGLESAGAPKPINPETGQHGAYWVLNEEERRKGFVRPIRTSYIHDRCGSVTTMGMALSETYARDPSYYGSTFCVACRTHYPVSEFKWKDTDQVVGS